MPPRSRSPAKSAALAERRSPRLQSMAAVAASTPSTEHARSSRLQWLIMLAVFLDMTGVALVVPNLIFRWKEVGISPAGLGFVSSIYSAAQLIGGLTLGKLGDRRLGRKRTLLLSFAGAGVSYALVGMANSVEMLVLSRVLVGLVKQTMTCSTAIMTSLSSEATRAQALGRLASASTLAFLAGQAAGGALSSRLGRRAPCFVASSLFALNFLLVLALLPNDAPSSQPPPPPPPAKKKNTVAAAEKVAMGASSISRFRAGLAAFVGNFSSVFRSERAGHALLFRLAYGFLMRSTYSLHTLYEQQRWELTPATAGYLSTYRTALGLSVDALLIGVLARYFSESSLLLVALAASAANAAFEGSHSTFMLYACINMPVSSMAGALTRTNLSSLFSKAIPTRDAGAALSVLDVLNAAVGMLAPIYGGVLLHRLGVSFQPYLSLVHYLLLLALARATLARRSADQKAKAE